MFIIWLLYRGRCGKLVRCGFESLQSGAYKISVVSTWNLVALILSVRVPSVPPAPLFSSHGSIFEATERERLATGMCLVSIQERGQEKAKG